MPSIVYINAALGYGATGRIVEQTGILAQKYKFDVLVVHSARYGRNSSLKNFATGTVVDEKIHAIQSFLFDAQGYGSIRQTTRAIDFIEKHNPDIVHIHNLHSYYLNHRILFEYLQEKNIPVVWTLHDCWPFTGHCMYFDYIGCRKWKSMCFKCQLKSSYPRSIIDRSRRNYIQKKKLFSNISNLTLVPVSGWLGDIVRESFLKEKDVRVIHNGIDLDVFKPTVSNVRGKLGISESSFVVLGVANHFGGRKGFPDFLELHKRIPDVQIVLVGASPKEIEMSPKDMIVIGRTESQQELVELYSLADVFVNPTYEDNFPTTNLEALACGTPVITYNTGGSPEAVDKETGLIVPKGDVSSLINAIRTIKKNGKLHYTKACRARAVKNFNKDDRFMDYIELYNELLGR